jgi:hypothetical protein
VRTILQQSFVIRDGYVPKNINVGTTKAYGKFEVRGAATIINTHQGLSTYKVLIGKREGLRSLERSKHICEDNVKMYLIEMKYGPSLTGRYNLDPRKCASVGA